MNRYPLWKYAIIAIALIVSLIYAAPNLFGEIPAVQVAGKRSAIKVDEAMRDRLKGRARAILRKRDISFESLTRTMDALESRGAPA